MSLQKIFETNYKRWRHITLQYVVVILGIEHYRGQHGLYSTVIVKGSLRDPKKRVTWAAATFRKQFEPVGRKQKTKTALDRVLEDDDL
jgi:hypothetical protein